MKKLIILLLFMTTSLMAQSLGGDSYFTKGNTYWTLSGTTLSPTTSTHGIAGLSLRLNTATANYHTLTSGSSSATNLNAFNFVNTDINKTRTSLAQSTDTSSVSLSFLASGKPIVNIKGATGNTVLSIDSVGNVGLGAASPTADLDISGTGQKDLQVKSTDNEAYFFLDSPADNSAYFYFRSAGVNKWALGKDYATGDFSITKNGVSVFSALQSNGNIGLGTTTPLHKLALVSPTTSNNFAGFNLVNAFINKTRTTLAESIDTASVNVNISALGSPTFNITGKTGNSLFKVDSVKTTAAMMGNTAQQTITLGAGATTLAVSSNVVTVTGDGGANTIGTITGAVVGVYVFIFVDANVTITDTDAHTADTVDLAGTATNFTSADDKTLTLVYDGTSWYQTSTSTN